MKRGSTFLLGQSEHRENLFFFFSFLSLSFSIRFFFPFSLVGFPPFLFCWFLSFFPLSNALLPLFALHFISFSFSIFSHFLISLFSFIFSFLFLLWIASTEWSQKWETSSPLPPLLLVILQFFLIFFISLYFPHVTHGST